MSSAQDLHTHGVSDAAEVVVIGGGLAGLTAAVRAARAGRSVILLDGRGLGGRARTDERDGFLFNQGAHALYRGGAGLRVLRSLGIEPKGGLPPLRGGMGVRNDNSVALLPGHPLDSLRTTLLKTRSKPRIGLLMARLARIDTAPLATKSVTEWIDSCRLAPDARLLLEALVRTATYASAFEEFSADAAVTQVQMAMADNVLYIDGGWRTLVEALEALLVEAGGQVRHGAVTGIERAGDADGAGGWVVQTAGASPVRAGSVVLAAGGPAAMKSLLPVDPGWGDLGTEVTAACLDLGVRRAPRYPVVLGMGRPLYLSRHSPSAALAPDGCFVVHLMRYGARTSEEDRAELWDLARLAGIDDESLVTDRFLHRMIVTHALPRPGRGLAGRPTVEVAGAPGLFVAGDWIGAEGLLSDAAFASGARAGELAAAFAQRARPTAVVAP